MSDHLVFVFSQILGLVLTSSCHNSLGKENSDSELSFDMFTAHSRARLLQERQLTKEIIPMKSSNRGGKPSNFRDQRSRGPEEHVGGGRRETLRPKPLFQAVDEEYESGEESGEEASATGSRWSSEHRHRREHHRSHSLLLQRKQFYCAQDCFSVSQESIFLLL